MFGLGFSEILLLGLLALLLIGPKELPEMARVIGRFINELKRTTEGFSSELKSQAKFQDPTDYLYERAKLKEANNSEINASESPTEQLEIPLNDAAPAAPLATNPEDKA